MSEDRPTKTCPDCAESVLAEARKCRYCGYRFDGARPPVAASATGGIMGLLRRPASSPASMPDLLEAWGIVLRDGEGPGTLCHGSIGRVGGYIVVTDRRLMFIPTILGSPAAQVVRDEHQLSDLLRVHHGRHRLRRALFLEWRDTRTVVIADGVQLARLVEALAPHTLLPAPPTEAPSDVR